VPWVTSPNQKIQTFVYRYVYINKKKPFQIIGRDLEMRDDYRAITYPEPVALVNVPMLSMIPAAIFPAWKLVIVPPVFPIPAFSRDAEIAIIAVPLVLVPVPAP
jgi:hypothetical protein